MPKTYKVKSAAKHVPVLRPPSRFLTRLVNFDPSSLEDMDYLNQRCANAIAVPRVFRGAVVNGDHSWFVLRSEGNTYEYNGNDSVAYNSPEGIEFLSRDNYGPPKSSAIRPLLVRQSQLLSGAGLGNCALCTVAFSLYYHSMPVKSVDAFLAWALLVSEDECAEIVRQRMISNGGSLY